MPSVFVNPMNRTRSNVSPSCVWTVAQVSFFRTPRTAIASGFAPRLPSRLNAEKKAQRDDSKDKDEDADPEGAERLDRLRANANVSIIRASAG